VERRKNIRQKKKEENCSKMNQSMRSFQFEGTVEVKSKFDAEFRRFRLEKPRFQTFESFKLLLCDLHHLKQVVFVVKYADEDNDLLPITNDDNYMAALKKAKPLLRLVIQRESESELDYRLVNGGRSSTLLTSLGLGGTPKDAKKNHLRISNPKEFRQVSAIIDVDVVPETCRRVKLLKHGSDKPLGFYIRDGTSVRVTPQGLEKVPGIFISRLVPGGLAESTGLLAVNDEVLEVNGIEVAGKSLDQVTDMMVANSSNLIVTVKPANQRTLMGPRRGSFSRNSAMSAHSMLSSSTQSGTGSEEHEDEDEIVDHHGSSFHSKNKPVLHL